MYQILYSLYQALVMILQPMAGALSHISGKVRRFHRGRSLNQPSWQEVYSQRKQHDAAVLWYCSSAGEFEQALPVMARLDAASSQSQARSICHVVVFFSQSGLDYVAKRYPDTLAVKAPYDLEANWQQVYSELKPKVSVVVRYELWPAFMKVAARQSHVAVIDAAIAASHPPAGVGRWLRAKLLAMADEVYVTAEDQPSEFLRYFSRKALAVGDSKYDRAFDRRNELKADEHPDILAMTSAIRERKVLMVGSGWPADISPILSAHKKLNQQESWVVVVAPHDVSSDMMAWIKTSCDQLGLSSAFLSRASARSLAPSMATDATDQASWDVLIVDKLGVLFELYHLADLVWVGGGMDRRVHNVLEPAIFNVPIGFGPGYHHSGEAVRLVADDLATVAESPKAIAMWWQNYPHSDQTARMQAAMTALAGASDRIAVKLSRIFIK